MMGRGCSVRVCKGNLNSILNRCAGKQKKAGILLSMRNTQ